MKRPPHVEGGVKQEQKERTVGMKYRRFLWCMAPVAILVAIFMAFPGCEDDPQTTDVDQYFANNPELEDPRVAGSKPLTITPAGASVSLQGQQIAFRALGGPSSYRWIVATPSNGTIAPSRQTDAAVYTAARVAPNTIIVSDSRGHSAIVQITVGTTRTLQITPSSYTFTASETNGLPASVDGSTLEFTLSGGVPPHGNWHVSNPGLGTIVKIDDFHARYTAKGTWGTGDNGISVMDSAENLATATVTIKYANQ